MLVLARKVGESIQIGEDIRIQVLSVQGQNVKIGVMAPKDVMIHREEVYDKIIEENKQAGKNHPPGKNIESLFTFGKKNKNNQDPSA